MPDIDGILKGARDALAVGRVFGEPIERDGVTVIPVAAIHGCGGGGGDKEQNGGAGYGLCARPVGVFIIRGETVKWQPAFDLNRALKALLPFAAAMMMLRCCCKRHEAHRHEAHRHGAHGHGCKGDGHACCKGHGHGCCGKRGRER